MLSRFYASNFRSLVNFEIEFGDFGLLLGPNGSGKSSVFDILAKLRSYVIETKDASDVFRAEDLPVWTDKEVGEVEQIFEIDLKDSEDIYSYRLVIGNNRGIGRVRMLRERLTLGGEPLFNYEVNQQNIATAQLFRDDGSRGPEVLVDWSRSGVGFLPPRSENTKLTRFKELLRSIFVVKMNPVLMGNESSGEASFPKMDLSNFADWYHFLIKEHLGKTYSLIQALQEIMPGFESLALKQSGEKSVLCADFRNAKTGKIDRLRFSQLSDGQKSIIALQTLLYCLPEENVVLCVDEPENYLALPEIQPWFNGLFWKIYDGSLQALLISHHPTAINHLRGDGIVWIERDESSGFARARPLQRNANGEGLPLSTLVERGWLEGTTDSSQEKGHSD